MTISASELSNARQAYEQDGVIAYPTEAVFGLGCKPESESALQKIFSLKQRSSLKGLIIIAAQFQQLHDYIDITDIDDLEEIQSSWPGPFTWIFPASTTISANVTGGRQTVAVRVSAHPVVQQLCKELGPLISTSANPSNSEPARSAEQVKAYFSRQIDCLIDAPVGAASKPTQIRDAISKKILRKA